MSGGRKHDPTSIRRKRRVVIEFRAVNQRSRVTPVARRDKDVGVKRRETREGNGIGGRRALRRVLANGCCRREDSQEGDYPPRSGTSRHHHHLFPLASLAARDDHHHCERIDGQSTAER